MSVKGESEHMIAAACRALVLCVCVCACVCVCVYVYIHTSFAHGGHHHFDEHGALSDGLSQRLGGAFGGLGDEGQGFYAHTTFDELWVGACVCVCICIRREFVR
jgi:hypothetical protein